jgi:hypothetical protein
MVATDVFKKLELACAHFIPNAILSPVISRLHGSVHSAGQFTHAPVAREKADQ